MPGLYDRLADQLGDENDKPTGLTPLDIADLPDDQRRVMFALLRDPNASSRGLALETLQQKLSDLEDLPAILAELSKNNWLIIMGEVPNERYKVNLRRKRGSDLGANLWASLANRLDPDQD